MKKLYPAKNQHAHHVIIQRIPFMFFSENKAEFVSFDKEKDGLFGVINIPFFAKKSLIVHELVHVAQHFVKEFTPKESLTEEYRIEAEARIVESLYEQV